LGHVLSEETKAKIAKSNTGKIASEVACQKMSESHSGIKNHNFGKKHSEELKAKMGAPKKGKLSPKRKKVLCLNNNKIYDCAKMAAQDLNISTSTVALVAQGKFQSLKGFRFKYL
jgi:group I intron endonuclease